MLQSLSDEDVKLRARPYEFAVHPHGRNQPIRGPQDRRRTYSEVQSMGTSLSLRQLWVIYKRMAIALGADPRDLAISQAAFYNGARGVLKVLSDMVDYGDYQELHDTITRHGRQIRKIEARPPHERRRSRTN